MNSLEKIDVFKTSLLRVDEPLPGLLGTVQALVAAESIGMGGLELDGMMPESSAELDGFCIDLARFALWLRSDDAPFTTLDELLAGPPVEIAQLLEAGT